MTPEFPQLPFSPDLTEIGVAEVVTALAHPSRQVFLESYDDMRLRVMDNIVTLVVRRYLVKEGIPHQAAPALSFSEADRYDIAIGGRRPAGAFTGMWISTCSYASQAGSPAAARRSTVPNWLENQFI